MEILRSPDKALRQKSEDISFFDDFLRMFVDLMVETMYEGGGVGLAAPQVGVNRNVIVIDPTGGDDSSALKVMINPKIITRRGSIESEEGCLSVPGFRGTVTRSESVDVEYFTQTGEKQTLTATGFLAIIIQHEIDHLHGILFVDRVSSLKITPKKKVKAAEKTA